MLIQKLLSIYHYVLHVLGAKNIISYDLPKPENPQDPALFLFTSNGRPAFTNKVPSLQYCRSQSCPHTRYTQHTRAQLNQMFTWPAVGPAASIQIQKPTGDV